MFHGTRHIAVLLPSLMLVVLAACSDTQPLPDIDTTVEGRVQVAKASLVAPTAAPLPTYTPAPAPAPEVVIKEVIVEKPVEVVVEKEVVKEVIVEKIVEVVVTATPKLQPWPMVI